MQILTYIKINRIKFRIMSRNGLLVKAFDYEVDRTFDFALA